MFEEGRVPQPFDNWHVCAACAQDGLALLQERHTSEHPRLKPTEISWRLFPQLSWWSKSNSKTCAVAELVGFFQTFSCTLTFLEGVELEFWRVFWGAFCKSCLPTSQIEFPTSMKHEFHWGCWNSAGPQGLESSPVNFCRNPLFAMPWIRVLCPVFSYPTWRLGCPKNESHWGIWVHPLMRGTNCSLHYA